MSGVHSRYTPRISFLIDIEIALNSSKDTPVLQTQNCWWQAALILFCNDTLSLDTPCYKSYCINRKPVIVFAMYFLYGFDVALQLNSNASLSVSLSSITTVHSSWTTLSMRILPQSHQNYNKIDSATTVITVNWQGYYCQARRKLLSSRYTKWESSTYSFSSPRRHFYSQLVWSLRVSRLSSAKLRPLLRQQTGSKFSARLTTISVI